MVCSLFPAQLLPFQLGYPSPLHSLSLCVPFLSFTFLYSTSPVSDSLQNYVAVIIYVSPFEQVSYEKLELFYLLLKT